MSKVRKYSSSLSLVKTFICKYPKWSILVLISLLFAGVAEGVGLATLFPLLKIAISSDSAGDDFISETVEGILALFGLEQSVGNLLIMIVVFIAIKAVFVMLAGREVGYASAHVANDLRLSLIRALMKARWSYFLTQPIGTLANAVATEAERASTGYITSCRIMAALIQVGIYTFFALRLSWEVTLIGLGAGVLMTAVLGFLVSLARRAGAMQTKLLKSIAVRLTDGLQGMKSLKSMAREDRLEPLLEKDIRDLNNAQRRQVFSKEGLRALQEPPMVVVLALGVYVALMWWEVEMAKLMILGVLFLRTVEQIGKIQISYQTTAIAESAYWSIKGAIEELDSLEEVNTGTKLPKLKREIVFENVCFSYGEIEVLKNVTFSIPANKFITLMGSSGAGKTTVADLLIGLMKPKSGDIKIDNLSMNEVNIKSWRGMIGYVPQETILFHESVYVNVTLGDPSLNADKAEFALRKAGLWSFVSSLPKGMDTVVGERGSRLSGGQRQRIAIARALIRNPRLLILDEVTTALDPRTEAEICQELKRLSGEMTVLAISHQEAMMEAADIIYSVNAGIVERMPSLDDVRAPIFQKK